MKILSDRIELLSNTELPDDLIKILYNAKIMASNKEFFRANSVLNVIESECKRRGIVIFNGYQMLKMFNSKGRLVDIRI